MQHWKEIARLWGIKHVFLNVKKVVSDLTEPAQSMEMTVEVGMKRLPVVMMVKNIKNKILFF